MKAEEKHLLLAEAIARLLREGLIADSRILAYMESTLGISSPEDLQSTLSDPFHGERESLIDLLLFPDESIQLALEDLLEKWAYDPEDEKSVLDLLVRSAPEAIVRFSGWQRPLILSLSREAAVGFLSRLKITRKYSEWIGRAADQWAAGHRADSSGHRAARWRRMLMVKLRNARFEFTSNRTAFLCAFLNGFPAESSAFFRYFDLILELLDESGKKDDLVEAIREKREFFSQLLQQAKELENRVQKGNPETLMLQGMRIPCVDTEALRQKTEMIDEILHKLKWGPQPSGGDASF